MEDVPLLPVFCYKGYKMLTVHLIQTPAPFFGGGGRRKPLIPEVGVIVANENEGESKDLAAVPK